MFIFRKQVKTRIEGHEKLESRDWGANPKDGEGLTAEREKQIRKRETRNESNPAALALPSVQNSNLSDRAIFTSIGDRPAARRVTPDRFLETFS